MSENSNYNSINSIVSVYHTNEISKECALLEIGVTNRAATPSNLSLIWNTNPAYKRPPLLSIYEI